MPRIARSIEGWTPRPERSSVGPQQESRGGEHEQPDQQARDGVGEFAAHELAHEKTEQRHHTTDHGAASADQNGRRGGVRAVSNQRPEPDSPAPRLAAGGSHGNLEGEEVEHDRRAQHRVADRVLGDR
jgi:hypothetical protein